MSETRQDDRHPATRCGGRKVCFAIAAALLLGLGAAIGVVATKASAHAGWHAWKQWRHHGPVTSEAQALERARELSGWVLDEVDATDAQRERIDTVLDAFVAKAYPLRERHREHHRAFVAELARPAIDREALEALRTRELALADALSGELLEALVAVSDVLDVEQRLALAEHLDRHRRHDHH